MIPLSTRREYPTDAAPKITFGSPEVNQPIQLISFNEKKQLTITEEGIKYFSTLSDTNFATLSVVGKYRTGKSYLMNRVLLDRSNGFSVGPTINPCTKGLWIWPSLIEVESAFKKTNILVIDTEGIGAYNEEENHDIKIFLVALLISSFFVYNSVGNIDEMAIQNLSLIINLGKHLQKTNEAEFDDLISSFPNFLWVVRDFALKLVDPTGNPISSKEYLEGALRIQKGSSETIESKNRIRRLITSFFKERDCSMLVRPIANENDIQNLAQIPLKNLRPEFLDQIQNLRKRIFLKIKPKSFKNKLVNGSTFINMCRIFCESINKGEIPSIENSWSSVCKVECQRLYMRILEEYGEKMREELKGGKLEKKELKAKHNQIKKEGLNAFNKNSFGEEKEGFYIKLVEGLKEKFIHFVHENDDLFKKEISIFMELKVNEIKNNVTSMTFQNLTNSINDIRSESMEKYNDNEVLISHINITLTNYLTELSYLMTSQRETELKNKELIYTEKIKNLEKNISILKSGAEKITLEYQEQMHNKEIEKSKSVFHGRKNIDRLEKTVSEKNNKINELQDRLSSSANLANELKIEKIDLASKISMLEDSFNTLRIETDKKIALLSQENELLRKDLSVKQDKIMNLNEILLDYKENQDNLETELNEQIELVKKLQIEKNEIENNHNEILKEKEECAKIWKTEKECIYKELSMNRKEFEENKKNNDFILKTLSAKKGPESTQDSSSLIKSNKNLSSALEKSEMRCLNLEQKLEKIADIQRMIKSAASLECNTCHNVFKAALFKTHLIDCLAKEENIDFEVRYEMSEENKFKKEFIVDFEYKEKTWTLKKSFKTVKCFARELSKAYPYLTAKPFFIGLMGKMKPEFKGNKNKPEYFEFKKMQISRFFTEILKISETRHSSLLCQFLALDIHFPNSFISPIMDLYSSISILDKENQTPKKNKTMNEYRASLKNISFKDLLNQIPNEKKDNRKLGGGTNQKIPPTHPPIIKSGFPQTARLGGSMAIKVGSSIFYDAGKEEERVINNSSLEQV